MHTVQTQRNSIVRNSIVPQLPAQVTILVLDVSASMLTNDSAGIRCSAADAYIDLNRENDQIGIVAMTNTNGAKDKQRFLTASIWQQPLPVGGHRQQLKNVIAQPPDGIPGCQNPVGATPIYDALAKAFAMLTKATHTAHGELHGSVIVMSDGQPDPDPDAQIEKIRSDLIPGFLQKKWPIATIALNGQPHYLAFLHELADKTDGRFYDDTQGSVVGLPSPLNITDFFLQVLAQRQNRTVNAHVPVQTLEGGAWHKDVPIVEHTRHLDIVIAKDQNISATLTTPEGRMFPPEPPEEGYITYIRDNPYYEIFSIDDPRPATYSLDISGQGQFLVYDLAISYLQVSITSPDQSVYALDQPFQLQAQVVDSQPGNDQRVCTPFALSAFIVYEGNGEKGSKALTKRVDMRKIDTCNTYGVPFPLSFAVLPGLYSITVSVSGDTDASIVDASTNIRLVHAPSIVYAQGASKQQRLVTVAQTRWPSFFQTIYNPVNPVLNWLGELPLQQHTLYPRVVLKPIIQVDAASSSSLAITGAMLYPAHGPSIHLSISKQKPVQIILPPDLAEGLYTLTYTLGGIFEDGSFQMHLSSTLRIIDISPPPNVVAFAWFVTVGYGLCIVFILLLALIVTGPAPFGEMLSRSHNSNDIYHYPFRKAHSRVRSFFFRHTLRSERVPEAKQQMKHLPVGLVLHFGYRKRIKVRCRAGYEGHWRYKGRDGGQEQELGRRLQVAGSVIYYGEHQVGSMIPPEEYMIMDGR